MGNGLLTKLGFRAGIPAEAGVGQAWGGRKAASEDTGARGSLFDAKGVKLKPLTRDSGAAVRGTPIW